ncbi:hypothetical protein ACC796_36395, partial [Rhizobium ruizarguesonis]
CQEHLAKSGCRLLYEGVANTFGSAGGTGPPLQEKSNARVADTILQWNPLFPLLILSEPPSWRSRDLDEMSPHVVTFFRLVSRERQLG